MKEYFCLFAKIREAALRQRERESSVRFWGVRRLCGAVGSTVEHAAGGGNRIAGAKGGLGEAGRREPPGRY